MMEQAVKDYRKTMEEAMQRALETQERLSKDLGVEVTAADRQEIIDNHMQQMVQYEAMMKQQMQIMSAAMGNGADMQALQDQLAEYMEEDEEMSDEEYAAWLKANAVPAKYQKYMPIGAVLIGTHGEPTETLRLFSDADDIEGMLEGGWGIEDAKEGVKMLASLLDGRHSKKFAKEFELAKAGKFDELDEDDAESYQLCAEAIVEALELPQKLVDNCKTLYAWDLDRIGYLARLFYNVEYITEEEAWQWMEKAAVKVKENFPSWEDYFVSLLLGRALAMGVAREPFDVVYYLLKENTDLLKSNPISKL